MQDLLHTPEGVRDIIGAECLKKHDTINGMMQIILSYGYTRMDTPGFEYAETFSRDYSRSSINDLYKFTDRDGNILSLRPDFTPSIARAAARYFSHDESALRICYKGNVYKNKASLKGLLNESTQLGAEFIGDSSLDADAEIIAIAVNCINSTGIAEFKLSLGHSRIFDGLCSLCELSDEDKESLKTLISNKNFFGMEDYLSEKKVEEKIIKIFKKCVGVYEDEKEFDALVSELSAQKDSLHKISTVYEAVSYIKELSQKLKEQSVSGNITIDLSIISNFDYYTGIIFYASAYGSGRAILSGGRYDNLLSHFGKDAPAIGFAVYCDDLLAAISNENKNDGYLTVALGKGRLAKTALKMFEKIGIAPGDYDKDSRKLIFVDEKNKMKFFLAKVPDVPTYVEHGAADIGIVGLDTILEENRNIYQVLDLKFGKCRMCVCGLPKAKELLGSPRMMRVASKYPAIAKDYFNNHLHQDAEIIKLNGSIELAPILELTDVIVDIVETGSTLKENGLVILDEVCDLSARMVVNPVIMIMENKRIQKIIELFRKQVEDDKDN